MDPLKKIPSAGPYCSPILLLFTGYVLAACGANLPSSVVIPAGDEATPSGQTPGTTAAQTGTSDDGPPADAPSGINAVEVVSVDGNHFTLNGNAWTPRGVVVRGFVAPAGWSKKNMPINYQAQMAYNQNELMAISAFGADTIRFLISQPGLDSNSTIYNPNYINQVVSAIQTARKAHFVVEIAMQDEQPSGEPNFFVLPTAVTQRNWDLLNGVFGKDEGVMFELYNEPGLPASSKNWNLWANGGPITPNTMGPFTAIGMQALVTHLRAQGCLNTFVLDGLDHAHSLDGYIPITDPLGKVAYAVHPYFDGVVSTASDWDPLFGNASKTVPVFADEWSAWSGGDPNSTLGLGSIPTYQPAVDLLNYLREHNIGLAGGGFDVPGFMNQTVPGWVLTNYNNYSPNVTGDNAGALIHVNFMANYEKELTAADGLAP